MKDDAPALWEEALDGPYVPSREEEEQIALWLNELWERHKDDIPWTDSSPGPQ